MYWLVLILSGVLEAVWATALGRSEGFSRLLPTVVFGVALAASMAGLAYAMRGLPIGTAYAVWVGIGATLTDPEGPYVSRRPDHQGLLLHSVYHWPNRWDHVPAGASTPRGESSQWGDYHVREAALYVKRLASGEPYLTFFGGAASS